MLLVFDLDHAPKLQGQSSGTVVQASGGCYPVEPAPVGCDQ